MAPKVKIGGTVYGVRDVKAKTSAGKRGSATFTVRQPYASMTRFSNGQEVIIYDDTVDEYVDVSTTFAPYGPPGLCWYGTHDGAARVEDVDLPTGRWKNGSWELLLCLNSGVEFLTAMQGSLWLATFNTYGGINAGTHFTVSLAWDEVEEALVLKVQGYTWYGTGGENADEFVLMHIFDSPALQEGHAYRVSCAWQWNDTGGDGSTELHLYLDGTEADSQTGIGYIVHDAMDVDYLGYQIWAHGSSYELILTEVHVADIRMWQDMRSQTEVDDNKYDYLTGSEADLIGYWKCDEGTGTTLDDETSGGHDGALVIPEGQNDYPDWGVCVEDWLGTFDGTGTHESQLRDYRHFAGRILGVRMEKVEADVYDQVITVGDYSSRMDDVLVVGLVTGTALGTVLKRYVPRYLEDDGIGVRTVEAGPTIASARWFFDDARKAIDEMVEGYDGLWYVDPYGELRMHANGSVQAPFDIADSDDPKRYIGRMEKEDNAGKYFNRLYARAKASAGGQELTYLFVAEDAAEIAARAAAEGSSGVYEHYEDLAGVRTQEQAEQLIAGKLADAVAYGGSRTVRYTTRDRGLRVGQEQHIQHAELDLNDDFIVMQVTYKLVGEADEQWEVVATTARRLRGFEGMLTKMVDSKANFKADAVFEILRVTYPPT